MDTNSASESPVAAALGGIMFGLISLLGLFLASRAQDGTFFLFSLLLFAFGVLMIFGLITKHTKSRKKHA